MSRLFLRSISSATSSASAAGPSHYPQPQNVLSTLPLAVRKRRSELSNNPITPASPILSQLPFTPSDINEDEFENEGMKIKGPAKKFPLRLEEEFQQLRGKGQYKGDETSARKAFLKSNVAWRSRIRGVSVKKIEHLLKGASTTKPPRTTSSTGLEGEEIEEENQDESSSNFIDLSNEVTPTGEIVGQRIYLPNIQIRLVRNFTPPGEAYDPTIATFRIPNGMTKLDLRSYLKAVYDLDVTFIRTANYFAEVGRLYNGKKFRENGSLKNYKRAIVGLNEPFHYPDDLDEIYAQGREVGVGEQWGDRIKEQLEERFYIDSMKDYQTKARFKMYKGSRWRAKTHSNQGNIIRDIMQKRKEREEKIRLEADSMQKSQASQSALA